MYSAFKRLIQAYSVFVVIWFLANRFIQDSWWGLTILDKFAEYFLVASIPVFILSWFFRGRAMVLFSLLPVLVTAFFYLPFVSKFPIPMTKPNAGYFRMATYNIWNHNTNLDIAVKTINEINADAIAIQELTDVQQSEFVTLLSPSYPHYYVSQQVYGGTTALFSKTELINAVELDFDIDRPAVVADVEWNGNVISVVSAHLNPSFWAYHDKPLLEIPGNFSGYIKDQNTQAQMILDEFVKRSDSNAHMLACDCNSQETASTNRLLRTQLKEPFRTLGWQMGMESGGKIKYEKNLSHIDYIWFAGDAQPVAIYRATETAGSDHELVFADFYLTPKEVQ